MTPRHHTPHGFLHGFTLTEVMVTVTVTSIICMVLFGIFMSCVRIWNYCSAQSQAFPPAYTVVTRVNQELKNAIGNKIIVSNSITGVPHGPGEYDTVTFRLPQTDGDGKRGTYLWPLTSNREVRLYPVKETMSRGQQLYFIYRKETDLSTTPPKVIRDRAIAAHAKLPVFKCSASQDGRVFAIYSTVITIVGQEAAKKVETTFQSSMAIRNPSGN